MFLCLHHIHLFLESQLTLKFSSQLLFDAFPDVFPKNAPAATGDYAHYFLAPLTIAHPLISTRGASVVRRGDGTVSLTFF
jgi:hypothetical protein